MDYVYVGPAEWPLASAVASIAGLVMVFGRQLALAAVAVGDLASDDLRRAFVRAAGRPWVACVALLALPAAWPSSTIVRALQGTSRLEAEIEFARADGYYEDLIRSSGDRRKDRPTERPPGWTSFATSGLVMEVADYRRRSLRPGLDARWNGTTFRTDRLGHRGPEISPSKPPGTFRVVVLGSSNTMGHGVDDEQTYVRLLERWLADRAGQGRRVEVVNLAVSGDSPTQRLFRLLQEVCGLDPDWIFCDVTALDLSLEEQHLRWVLERGLTPPFDFVASALAGSGVAAGDSPEAFHAKFRAQIKPLIGRAFEGWAAESRRLGAPLAVLVLPRADSKTKSSGLFRMFRDLASAHALPALDLSDAFDRFDLDEYRIGPWDHHPNALGHLLIFARLRDALLADGAFLSAMDGTPPAR